MESPDQASTHLSPGLHAGSPVPDVDGALRMALKRALAASGIPRELIAGQLSLLLGYQVRRHHIEAWCGESKTRYHLPAVAVIALCRILNTTDLIQILSAALGGRAVFGRDLIRFELAELEDQHTALSRMIERRRRLFDEEAAR
jgi:hypothetical protein